MSVAVIIPFRLRETGDMRRGANLAVVHAWWYAHGYEPMIVSDGGAGDEQFNRHAAYNLAVSGNPEADVFVFTEADMLIHPDQIRRAVDLAEQTPGLVVPFTQYRYWSDQDTAWLRDIYDDSGTKSLADWWGYPAEDPGSLFQSRAEHIMDGGKSIGAVNVVSRKTLEITGGYTEATSGNWYDDNIINEGFAYLTRQRTRYVGGPAVHMYHLPGHSGDHLTDADRRATENNKRLLHTMRRNIRMGRIGAVRSLMEVRK